MDRDTHHRLRENCFEISSLLAIALTVKECIEHIIEWRSMVWHFSLLFNVDQIYILISLL